MILCETIGEHSQIIPLNEVLKWPAHIKKGKNYCVKLNYYEMRRSKIVQLRKDAKFISVNRNPLDIAASFKKIEEVRGRARWMLLGGGDLNTPIYLDAVKQYQAFLAWRNKFKDLPNHLVLNFEDMILKPEETFKKVFDFLGFEFEERIKDFINKYVSDDPVPNYPGTPADDRPYQAFSVSPNKKIGSYKDVLTKQEIWRINAFLSGN
ncbi:hypothetical protein ES703_88848 [subsurface metagenome]